MAKTLSSILILSFALVQVADAIRKKNHATEAAGQLMTKCLAEGVKDETEGMLVTWGSTDKVRDCSVVRHVEAEGLTYMYKFSEAFTVVFDKTNKCECLVDGESIASFTPINIHQAKVCQGTIVEEDPMAIKRQCWEAYKKGRGTRFNELGAIIVPEYKEPWLSGAFRVGWEGTCEGEACDSITLPGVLDGMSREHKRLIGDAIKKVMDGKKNEVQKTLLDMIHILPSSALDDAEFQRIDEDNDGTLSLDELSDFYPQFDSEVIAGFIKEVDVNGSGTVDLDEFSKLKEKMRDYDPNIDLIDGEVDFYLSPSGEIKELKAEWKVKTVVCMKGGKELSDDECESAGDKDETIQEFNTNC